MGIPSALFNFFFFEMHLNNKIIPVKVGAGWRKAVPRAERGPPGWCVCDFWVGPALAVCPHVASSLPRCSRLRTPRPPGPQEAPPDVWPRGQQGPQAGDLRRDLRTCVPVPKPRPAGGHGRALSSLLGSRAAPGLSPRSSSEKSLLVRERKAASREVWPLPPAFQTETGDRASHDGEVSGEVPAQTPLLSGVTLP